MQSKFLGFDKYYISSLRFVPKSNILTKRKKYISDDSEWSQKILNSYKVVSRWMHS